MTGILALVGGGEWREGCTFDATLLEAAATDQVVVLPTGAAYENPAALVERARGWFAGLGAEVVEVPVLTRRDAFVEEHVAALAAARFIYLAGSSAMHLRATLKDTPVLDAILQGWGAGAVLAGTNAGADVLCDPMVDSRGGAFTVGLGVVSALAVIPKVDQWSRDKVNRTVELVPRGVWLAGLPTGTALLRQPDGTWGSEGMGTVDVYLAGRRMAVADLEA